MPRVRRDESRSRICEWPSWAHESLTLVDSRNSGLKSGVIRFQDARSLVDCRLDSPVEAATSLQKHIGVGRPQLKMRRGNPGARQRVHLAEY